MNRTSFNNFKDIKLPDKIVSDFFLYDDGIDEKILIFACRRALELLKTMNIFYGDGTFKVAPHPFVQLYSLHVDLSRAEDTVSFVPIIYARLPNKKQETYKRLFTILSTQFGMRMVQYRCDYEVAAQQAVREVFEHVTVRGCYYHYLNAIWRMSKKLNVNTTNEGRKITHLLTLLSLLPPVLIPEGYLSVLEIFPQNESFQKFQEYFETQWLNNITGEVFSCYGQKNRTTNAIEGWLWHWS